METQTVTLTKREAAMKMSLDMIREWCCSNLKGKKAVKIAISCGKKRYEFLADHTGFVLKGKNNPDYYYTKSKSGSVVFTGRRTCSYNPVVSDEK